MSFFRTPQQLKRKAPGSYVDGVWVQGGLETDFTISATIQPASLSDYDELRATAGGRRIERAVRIYTNERLVVAGETDNNGDVLIWEGARYEVIAVSPWRTTLIKHYRYWASKELEA